MENVLNQIVSAFIAAVVGGIVGLFFDRLKGKSGDGSPGDGTVGGRTPGRPGSKKLLFIIIGAVLGILLWWLILQLTQKVLWTFDNGTNDWDYLRESGDASTQVLADSGNKSLRAEFDFAPIISGLPSQDTDPRATFWVDNVNMDWSHYRKLTMDITNLTGYPLEVIFSVTVKGCFYEFGDYENVLVQSGPTHVVFDMQKEKYKTCQKPKEFNNPPPPLNEVQRFFLIVGTNAAPEQLNPKGDAILIDNVKLKK